MNLFQHIYISHCMNNFNILQKGSKHLASKNSPNQLCQGPHQPTCADMSTVLSLQKKLTCFGHTKFTELKRLFLSLSPDTLNLKLCIWYSISRSYICTILIILLFSFIIVPFQYLPLLSF